MPKKGTNGPNDKNGGTKHYPPPMPKPNNPRPGGTK